MCKEKYIFIYKNWTYNLGTIISFYLPRHPFLYINKSAQKMPIYIIDEVASIIWKMKKRRISEKK
jgi:hypothetical protein